MLRKRIQSATVRGLLVGTIAVATPFASGQQATGPRTAARPQGTQSAVPGKLVLGSVESADSPRLFLGDPVNGSIPKPSNEIARSTDGTKSKSSSRQGEPTAAPPKAVLQFGEDDDEGISFSRSTTAPSASRRVVPVATKKISRGTLDPSDSLMKSTDNTSQLQISSVRQLPPTLSIGNLGPALKEDSGLELTEEPTEELLELGSEESIPPDDLDIAPTALALAPPESPKLLQRSGLQLSDPGIPEPILMKNGSVHEDPSPRNPPVRRPLPTGPISRPIDLEGQFASDVDEKIDAEEVIIEEQVIEEETPDEFAESSEVLIEEEIGLPAVDPVLVEDVREEAEELQEDAPDEVLTKRPRPVRIPFSMDEINREQKAGASGKLVSGTTKNSGHAELENERHQEEPAIDSQSNKSGKEDQGVDAIRASRPGTGVAPVINKGSISGITQNDSQRLARTAACLDYYLSHPESTSGRSPWAVMHALLAFGPDYELQHGNSRVNAIGWMCHNGTCRTQRMFTPRGRSFVPNVGAGVQGHEGQFLAILAQSNVPLDYPIQIGRAKFTVEDLVRHEMATCKEKSELTFKLIGLSYYLDSNKQWRANDGKVWSISKLIQEELAQPIVGAACGGTHRLMGFSFSVKQRAMQGQPINGQFARADQFVSGYIDYTWRLQNPDGSFSTSWYEGRGNEPIDERKVQTTGHMLEWLMYTLPDSELNQARVQKSIDFLLSHIYDNKEHKWPIGPRGHATRAIALYQARYQEIQKSNPGLLQKVTSTATKSAPFSKR